MAISKAKRELVYNKYNGRCAYCGREIAYKNMQVDHFIPKNGYFDKGTDIWIFFGSPVTTSRPLIS